MFRKIYQFFVNIHPWFQDLYDESTGKTSIKQPTIDLGIGHAIMLKEAKDQCDYLIVGLQYDPSIDRPEKNRPVQSYLERTVMLKSMKYIDKIVFYETESDLIELLKKVKPDVRILGGDWEGKKFTGYELPMKYYFNSREHNWSSSNLRDRVYRSELNKRISREEEKTDKE
jgi:glycerol-3-phosphate cytidylyltransferase